MKKYYVFKINITILNVISVILLIGMVAFTAVIFPRAMFNSMEVFSNFKITLLFIPLMVFYLILHELFHALGYIINGADYKKITFGAEIEKGVLYCLCKDDISKKNILMSLMYPLFFLGVVTYIISIVFNLPILLILSIINISGAAGDIMYFLFIIKLEKNMLFSEMDDGTSFAIKSNADPTNFSHYGLDYVGQQSRISRNDFKRIKISKLSWVFFVITVILLILSFFV